MPLTEKKPLSSNAIKLIAIAAMTVDHIAWAVFPGYPKEFLPPAHASHRAHHLPDYKVTASPRGITTRGTSASIPRVSLFPR